MRSALSRPASRRPGSRGTRTVRLQAIRKMIETGRRGHARDRRDPRSATRAHRCRPPSPRRWSTLSGARKRTGRHSRRGVPEAGGDQGSGESSCCWRPRKRTKRFRRSTIPGFCDGSSPGSGPTRRSPGFGRAPFATLSSSAISARPSSSGRAQPGLNFVRHRRHAPGLRSAEARPEGRRGLRPGPGEPETRGASSSARCRGRRRFRRTSRTTGVGGIAGNRQAGRCGRLEELRLKAHERKRWPAARPSGTGRPRPWSFSRGGRRSGTGWRDPPAQMNHCPADRPARSARDRSSGTGFAPRRGDFLSHRRKAPRGRSVSSPSIQKPAPLGTAANFFSRRATRLTEREGLRQEAPGPREEGRAARDKSGRGAPRRRRARREGRRARGREAAAPRRPRPRWKQPSSKNSRGGRPRSDA